MPRDLVYACATTAALAGDLAAAIAMLLSYDCWLRVSEVAALAADAVVDHRGVADPVGRGVSVFIARAKTGVRQAVAIESAEVAALLLAWKVATEQAGGARLFPTPDKLRSALARALRALGADGPEWETRGLQFVWHSFRHGGASRAHLAGRDLSAILIRGRWAVESSGRHYIQAGRQMLLSLALPRTVSDLARRAQHVGLISILASDLPARLRNV